MANKREWLIELRKEKNKTQQDVAIAGDISRQYYSFIESGERGVPVPTAKRIAAALGFDWQRFYEEPAEEKEKTATPA